MGIRNVTFKGLTLFCVLLILPLLTSSCAVDEFELLRNLTDVALQGIDAPVKSVDDVKNIVDDATQSSLYKIVSNRSAEDYATGHVPGAINISWKSIAEDSSLALLDKGTDVITYCYTGHTGGIAATILTVLGYSTSNMKYGMMGWTDDPDVLNTTPFDCDPPNYDTETTSNDPSADNLLPAISTGGTNAEDIAQSQAQAYLSSGRAPTISVDEVKNIVDDATQSTLYTIVSVRSAEHYATGHVQGAINIPWKDIAKVENLTKIPTDKKVITYCYTGHTGAIATTVLNLLGYEAYNMKFGMMGWTDDPDVLNIPVFDCDPPNYDTES